MTQIPKEIQELALPSDIGTLQAIPVTLTCGCHASWTRKRQVRNDLEAALPCDPELALAQLRVEIRQMIAETHEALTSHGNSEPRGC